MHAANEACNPQQTTLPNTTVPAVDILEGPNGWTLRFDVPGVSREELTIELEDRTLIVDTRAVEGREPTRRYKRLLRVPSGLDPQGIRAHLEHGVLELSLPKPAAARRTRIEVATA